jgi:hypothetical protein
VGWMQDTLRTALEQQLRSAIAQNGSLRIYLWSFDGEISGRGPGRGWHLQLHFEDPTQDGGARHVSIGSGTVMDPELSEQLQTWLTDAARRHPGKLPPRIEVDTNS